MNERIKELVKKSTVTDSDWFRFFDKQKFAELIVRECAQIAHDSHPADLPFVSGKILTHFGVDDDQ